MVLTYISMGLLLLATLKSFLDEMLKKRETAHYIVRHQIFMEYAYQHLFMRVSQTWHPTTNGDISKEQMIADSGSDKSAKNVSPVPDILDSEPKDKIGEVEVDKESRSNGINIYILII